MNKKAFTLIELLTVIAIIGVLSGMLLPVLSQARERAKETNCRVTINSIQTALGMYAVDYGMYPPSSNSATQHNGNSHHGIADINNLVMALLSPSLGGPYMDFKACNLIDDGGPDYDRYVFKDPWGQAYIYVCQKRLRWDAGLSKWVLDNVSDSYGPFHPGTTSKENNAYNIYSLGSDKKTFNDSTYPSGTNWDESVLFNDEEDGDTGDDVNNWN